MEDVCCCPASMLYRISLRVEDALRFHCCVVQNLDLVGKGRQIRLRG